MSKKLNLDGMLIGSDKQDYQFYPSSIKSLNRALGHAEGIRGGTIMQLLAQPGHGKTTLALDYIAQAQRQGIKEVTIQLGKVERTVNALFVDLERTFDSVYAGRIGVDLDKILVYRPDYAEQGLPVIEHLLAKGIQVVVFDSVPALITKDEFDKEIDDPARMAGSANLLSRWILRLLGLVDNANALFIFINQYRANISSMARSEKKPYGPYALRYFSRITLELARIRTDEDKLYIQATVAKNKQGGGNQKCEYIMLNGKGLGPEFDILFLAMEYDIIQKAGAWYEYNGQKAQGMDNCVLTYDMKQIALEVDKRIREDLNGRS